MYYLHHNDEGKVEPPTYPVGLVLDVDDTLLNTLAVRGPYKGENLHSISRVEAAHVMGKILKNEFLRAVTPDISTRAFLDASEHSTAGSLAKLLHMAGLAESAHINPDDELLQVFVSLRQELHLKNIRRWAGLNPGARALLRHGRDYTEYGNAVATTQPGNEFAVVYDHFELYDYLDLKNVVHADISFNTKPHAEPYRVAAKSLLPASMKRHIEEKTIRSIWGVDDSMLGLQSVHGARLTSVGMGSIHPATELARLPYVDFAVDGLPDVVILARSIARQNQS